MGSTKIFSGFGTNVAKMPQETSPQGETAQRKPKLLYRYDGT